MIRVAIVDDERMYYEQIVKYIRRFEQEQNEKISETYFKDGDEIAGGYRAEYDIILMDVDMQFMNGINAAIEIRKYDREVILIFISNMPQFALQGYQVEAMDYLIKPVRYEEFCKLLKRAIEKINRRKEIYLAITVKGGVQKVRVSDITYVESHGHMLTYHTLTDSYDSYGTIKEATDHLEKFHFSRGNKGYLINLAHVSGITDGCAAVGMERLPISRTKKQQFMNELVTYISQM